MDDLGGWFCFGNPAEPIVGWAACVCVGQAGHPFEHRTGSANHVAGGDNVHLKVIGKVDL